MRAIVNNFKLVLVLFSIVSLTTNLAANDFDASTRSVAMGNSGVTLISQQAAFYNPGALGFFYTDIQFSSFSSLTSNYTTTSPSSFSLPGISSIITPIYRNQIEAPFYSKQFGIGMQVYNRSNNEGQGGLTIALAYSGSALKVKNIYSVNEYYLDISRQPLAPLPEHSNDRVDMLSAAVAIRGSIDFGIGTTLKLFKAIGDESSSKAATMDIGVLAKRSWEINPKETDRVLLLTPSIGIAAINIGSEKQLFESRYILDRSINFGTSFLWEVKNQQKTELSFLTTIEYSIHHSSQFRTYANTGRPDTQQNNSGVISGGKAFDIRYTEEPSKSRFGFELGLHEALYLRLGRYEDKIRAGYFGSYKADLQNYGIGLQSTGLINMLKLNRGFFNWIESSLDIRYDYARVDGKFTTDTNHHQLSISLK